MIYRNSKYNRIIDQFLDSHQKYGFPDLADKSPRYVRYHLAKHIRQRGLEDIVDVQVMGKGVMLENKKIDVISIRSTTPT